MRRRQAEPRRRRPVGRETAGVYLVEGLRGIGLVAALAFVVAVIAVLLAAVIDVLF